MKLKFDAEQQFQLDAIESVADLFVGQQTTSGAGLFGESTLGMFQNERGVGNLLQIDEGALLENLRRVQENNKLPIQSELAGKHFSIEMETGTGKTYVYLRTMFELHQRFGFSKFIIVVPGKAIREGVLNSLEITKEHLRNLYGNPTYSFFAYNSKRPADLRAFATSNALSVMLINIEAFNTEDNIINSYRDPMGGALIELVQQTHPIVIMDEPQNMESPAAQAAIAALNPLCTLRYSATHRNLYNQIYRLGPVEAYDQGLVKRIEVASVAEEGSQNDAYIKVLDIKAGKRAITATLEIEQNLKGEIKKVKIKCSTLGADSDLYTLSGNLPAYDGYTLNSINAETEEVEFGNGIVVSKNAAVGEMKDEIMKQQVAETIREHFEKMLKFAKAGQDIKVLSLFFIDRVANYRDHEAGKSGKIALWFEELYEEIRKQSKYSGLSVPEVSKVHDGYFSKDKKGVNKDTRGSTEEDRSTYERIMKDKERLLSVEEPLQFIFSHSALKEGWDNPNVFQICTLNEAESYVKKRQEIGRGLRLPVNQQGDRIFDRSINTLTVIANESYETFARSLQQEIEEETGQAFGRERIVDKRKRKQVSLRKHWELDERFIELWSRINKRTRYAVTLDMDAFLARATEALATIPSQEPRIRVDVASLNFDQSKGILTTKRAERTGKSFAQSLPVPDVLSYIALHTELRTETVARILKDAGVLGKLRSNPQYVMDQAVSEIKRVMQTMIIDGIKYERIVGSEYEMQIFNDAEIESYLNNMRKVEVPEKTLYDYIVCDSEVEKEFAQELEARDEVEFYMKLPSRFKIDTPLGSYNPDWAIIFYGDTKLYLVAETKGTNRMDELSISEQLKIKAGTKHFAAIGEAIYIAPIRDMGGLSERLKEV